jgi:hypothetical protein
LIKKLFKFPADRAFPVVDIYRQFLMHPHSSEHYKLFENGIEYLGTLIQYLKDEHTNHQTQLVALRSICNLFQNSASKFVMLSKVKWISEECQKFLTSDNKNIRHAAITVFLKYLS